VAVGRKGAHRGGQSMAAKSAAERWSTGVRTDGCRSRLSGRRAAWDDDEACDMLGAAGGGGRLVVHAGEQW
jgi:hypothetical protein